jgi:hypothetical protein
LGYYGLWSVGCDASVKESHFDDVFRWCNDRCGDGGVTECDQVAGLVVDGDGYTAEWEGCSGVGAEESVLFLAAAASFVDAHFSFRINIEEGRVGINDGVPYLGDATTIP